MIAAKKMWDWKAYDYELSFVTKDGKTIKLPYTIASRKSNTVRTNSYVKAEVSQKRVTSGPTTINENQVPNNVLTALN